MTLSLSTYALCLTLAGIALLIIAIIIGFKHNFKRNAKLLSHDKNQGFSTTKPIYNGGDKRRFSSWNAHRGLNLKLGFFISIVTALCAMSWTTFNSEIEYNHWASSDEVMEIEITPPPTASMPQPPPPPPVIAPLEEVVAVDEPLEFIEETITPDPLIDNSNQISEDIHTPVPAPPPLPKPVEKEDRKFRIVEQMPRFPGCENENLPKKEMKECADEKLLQFIYSHIKYPTMALENGIEGSVVVQFVVEKDGKISEIQVLRDIGAGTGSEAQRVIELMNSQDIKWTPGKQRGRPVRVQFTLPIKFKLK